MRKIVAGAFVSLDGVMQAPGAPEEDSSGGFDLGGWAFPYWDEMMDQSMGPLFAGPFDLLLGRKTYEIFAAYWPYMKGDPIGEAFNRAAKHVVTSSSEPLSWANSHAISDGVEGVARLRASDGPDLVIQGSSTLYPDLMARNLIDRLLLMTFPLVLGKGKRLFAQGGPSGALRLVENKVSATGVIIASYEPAGEVRAGSFATSEPSQAELDRREKVRREG
jgi:dihydrofolate reductase